MGIKKILHWIWRFTLSLIPDVLVMAGGALAAHGCFLISDAAGWIASGAVLVAAAVIWSKGGGSA